MAIRIFHIKTELPDSSGVWSSYNVAAPSAEAAIKKLRRKYALSRRLQERVLSVECLATETD